MSNNAGLLIRDAQQDDANFIFNSWLKSFRRSWFAQRIPNDIFYSQQHKVVEEILSRVTTQAHVITPATDPATICGYAVTEAIPGTEGRAKLVHYTYVKETFRRLGLATRLLSHAGIGPDYGQQIVFLSHITSHFAPLAEKHGYVYNPFVLYRGLYK